MTKKRNLEKTIYAPPSAVVAYFRRLFLTPPPHAKTLLCSRGRPRHSIILVPPPPSPHATTYIWGLPSSDVEEFSFADRTQGRSTQCSYDAFLGDFRAVKVSIEVLADSLVRVVRGTPCSRKVFSSSQEVQKGPWKCGPPPSPTSFSLLSLFSLPELTL